MRVTLEFFQNEQSLYIDGVEQFTVDIDPLPQNMLFGNGFWVQIWSSAGQARGMDNILLQELEAPEPEPWTPVEPGEVYWVNTTTVRTSESNGGDPRTVAEGYGRIIGVAVDSVNETVYWTDAGDIFRSDLSGANAARIYDGDGSTQAIAVDPVRGKIYWTEWATGLYSADLDGQGVTPLLDLDDYGQATGSGAVTIDPVTGRVYWAEVIAGTVVRLDANGGGAATVATLGANTYGLAVDGESGRLYYTVFGAEGSLNYYDLVSGETTEVLSGLKEPLGVALTAANNGIFWAERTGGKISRAFLNENGEIEGSINTIRIGEISPFGLAVTSDATGPVPPPAKRRLFVYDGFEYNARDLVGQDGGLGWAGPWVESQEVNGPYPFALAASPGLTFGDLQAAGGKAEISNGRRAFRTIDTAGINPEQLDTNGNLGVPGTSVWASFVVEGLTASPTDGFWGISFFRGDAETLFFGKSATTDKLRLSGQGQPAQEFMDSPLSPTDKHFIILRFDFVDNGNDVVTLFADLDPMARTPSDDDARGTFSAADFSFNRIRLANNGGPGGTFDEIRIGATWADVTPVPFRGLVNGDLEDEPFTRGWSVNVGAKEHPGIVPGSGKAAFVPSGGATENPIRLIQFFPQWIELTGDPLPANPSPVDPVTGGRTADHFIPTGPQWQLGFHAAVGAPENGGDRSLNLLLGHAPSAAYNVANLPVINFRITGDGSGQVYNNSNPAFSTGWHVILPAGTFEASEHADDAFIDPSVYYLQFDGDYSTEQPSYTVSVRRAGEDDFFAVSDAASYWQYEVPPAGSGITMVHFHGYVQAPYVIDDIHLVTIGEPTGYAAWAENHFNPSELADPSISGPDADADGDGIPNLIEYAFGGDPRKASRSILPVTGPIEVEGETYLTITYTRSSAATDIAYRAEASGDLIAWGAGPVEVGSSDNGDGTISVTYRDAEPIRTAGRRFLRVHISNAGQ